MIPGKFAHALHILTLLSKYPDDYLTSEFIAGSLNINPALVRKEIANLKRNRLVESKEGKNGGTKLIKPASEITLDYVFRITMGSLSLGFSKNKPNPDCPVGKEMNNKLKSLYADLTEKTSKQLQDISLLNFSDTF